MDLHEFSAEMAKRGCVTDGKLFCGNYLDKPFSVIFLNGKPGGKTVFRVKFRFDRKVKNSFVKDLARQMKGEMKLLNVANDPNSLEFTATVSQKVDFAGSFDRLMQLCTEGANAMGYVNPPLCPVCMGQACDAYAYYGGSYTRVHAGCVQQQNNQTVAKINENELNGSYGLGFLGAFLGSIVGTIPSVLVILFFNVISAWLCALVPLGAYYGYKICKGKMNNAAFAASVVMSVIMIPGLDYLTELAFTFQEYGELFSPLLYIEMVAAFPEEFLPFLLQAALFIGLGLVCVFGIVRQGNKHFYQNAAFSNATVRPIEQAAPVQPTQP